MAGSIMCSIERLRTTLTLMCGSRGVDALLRWQKRASALANRRGLPQLPRSCLAAASQRSAASRRSQRRRSAPRPSLRRAAEAMGALASKGDAAPAPAPAAGPAVGKSGKKICCSCPETKKPRDECVVLKGEAACAELIEAHKRCLRLEGFRV